MNSENKFTEAPASVTYSLLTQNNYPILFSVRDMDENKLLLRMKSLEQSFTDMGFQANNKTGKVSKPKEYVEGNCPICGGKLVKFTTKTGKSGIQCENRRWDAVSKSTVGCEYIKWDSDITSAPKTSPGGSQSLTGATEAQKNLIIKLAPLQWKEGMSKMEASQLIQSITNK